MLNLNNVGVKVNQNDVTFSICLPRITSPDFKVRVLYINKSNQFDANTNAVSIDLHYTNTANKWGDVNEDLWKSSSVHLQNGTYMYRYEIEGPSKTNGNTIKSIYFGDPFAKETANGVFSVFHVGNNNQIQINDPATFKVPWLKDAIIYELNVSDFNNTFYGIIERLPYLKTLGINVIQLMPITGIDSEYEWGYTPINYFAPEERFGGPEGLKNLVQECHNNDIAVVLDLVCPHSSKLFPYNIGYEEFFHLWYDHQYMDNDVLRRSPNPIVSKYHNYGNKNDFRIKSTKEFFKLVCEFWINEYHIDGFRFDHLNGFVDNKVNQRQNRYNIDWNSYRPEFDAINELTHNLYDFSKQYNRFLDSSNKSRIIQIAEDLDKGSYHLSNASASRSTINGCWEEQLYRSSTDMAVCQCLNGEYLNEIIMANDRWNNYTGNKLAGSNNDIINVSPIIYNNCHDKSFLIYRIINNKEWENGTLDFIQGIKNIPWYKSQPYAIALLTCVGTPMLWAGEEFAESYGLHSSSTNDRVRISRPLHWDNFYNPSHNPNSSLDKTVLPLTQLYRHLCKIRNDNETLRGPRSNANKELENFPEKIIIYSRWLNNEKFIIAINFSDNTKTVILNKSGRWTDILDKCYHPNSPYEINSSTGNKLEINIPSNFGRILKLS